MSSFCFGQQVSNTAARAKTIPMIFNTLAFSLYRYSEKRKGITRDILLATDATATPIFCVTHPIRLKSEMNRKPITHAQKNQGWAVVLKLMGNPPFTIEPTITQTQ
jgi:hypothetical protein